MHYLLCDFEDSGATIVAASFSRKIHHPSISGDHYIAPPKDSQGSYCPWFLPRCRACNFTKQGVRKAAETSPKDGIDISMPRKAWERRGPKAPDKR